VSWYASGGDIALSGPYDSQVAAWAAFRTVPGHGGLFPADLKVWPDERTREELEAALEADAKARFRSEHRVMVNNAVRRSIR
jgi:hypothetical protein